MTSSPKRTKTMKPPMRSPLAASPRSIELPEGMRERILSKAFELWQGGGIETDTISKTGSTPRPS